MKTWFLSVILSLSFVSYNYCDDITDHEAALEEVTKKICQIAREKLKIQHTKPEDKVLILEYMRKKLKKTALDLGQNPDAHVKLILEGISLVADDENYQVICNRKYSEDQRRTQVIDNPRREMVSNVVEEKKQGVMHKLVLLVDSAMKKGKTLEEKRQNVEKLKEGLIRTYTKEATNNGLDEIKIRQFSNLLANGVDQTMHKILAKEGRRMEEGLLPNDNFPKKKLPREDHAQDKIALDDLPEIDPPKDDLPKIYDPKVDLPKGDPTKDYPRKDYPIANDTSSSTPLFKFRAGIVSTTSPLRPKGITEQTDVCFDTVKRTCAQLKDLQTFTCPDNGKVVKTHQVCDGVNDCANGSDETDCLHKVVARVNRATEVMSKIELARNCFQSIFENSIISRQGALLTDLLNTQIEFIKTYGAKRPVQKQTTPMPNAIDFGEIRRNVYHHVPIIDGVVNEVASVLRTFEMSLNSALCEHKGAQKVVDTQDISQLEMDLDKDGREQDWSPSTCQCNQQYCKNNTCHAKCKTFCYQTFSLSRIKCKPVEGGLDSVSIDLICDGKLDCFDEIDETGCTSSKVGMAKFEGIKSFDIVLTMIKKKYLSRALVNVRQQLAELQSHVQKIQQHSTSPKINIQGIKKLRNTYFKLVNAIYLEVMDNLEPGDSGEEAYDFLMDINTKMIEALKKTHTGNTKVISHDDCLCRGPECSNDCTPRCKRSCVVKYSLTNYICSTNSDASSNITTVPIETVCNGRINCPNGADELKCSPEICRIHHAKVLRHNIEIVGEKYKGTLMGDALDTWKGTILPALVILEKRERVTPRLMKNTVTQILNDLSLAFMSLEQYRRLDTEPILKKFTKMSQRIIESLKTCTK